MTAWQTPFMATPDELANWNADAWNETDRSGACEPNPADKLIVGGVDD